MAAAKAAALLHDLGESKIPLELLDEIAAGVAIRYNTGNLEHGCPGTHAADGMTSISDEVTKGVSTDPLHEPKLPVVRLNGDIGVLKRDGSTRWCRNYSITSGSSTTE